MSSDIQFLSEATSAVPLVQPSSNDDSFASFVLLQEEPVDELSIVKLQLSKAEENLQFLEDDNAQLKSLLSSVPPLTVSALSEPSAQTALMARSLLHQQQQAEKARTTFIVLKQLESPELMFFSSKYASQEDSIV